MVDKMNADILRQKAEESLKARHSQYNTVLSESDILRLVHDLEVYQIELKMQNKELQLAKNEAELATAKYTELYEFAPSGYFILSGKGKIIQLNLAGAQILGKPRSQLKNSLFAFLVTDESKPAFRLFLSSVFNSNAKETCEVSLYIPHSQPLQVSITGLAEPDKDECFVTLVDITERKRNEKEILLAYEELTFQNEEKAKRAAELAIAYAELSFQNEEKAKRAAELVLANAELAFQIDEKAKRADELVVANKELLFQNNEKTKRANELMDANSLITFQRDRMDEIASLVPGVVYQYRLRPDGSSCFPYASEAIRQIYHVTPEEVREDAGKVFSNLHPDDHDEVVHSIQVSAKKLTPWKHEYRTKFDDGTIRTVFGNALPVAEADGSVLWTGFITDITEQRRSTDALQQSEERFRVVVENSPMANFVHSNGIILYANPAAVHLFLGASSQDIEGTSIWDRIHPDFHSIVLERIRKGIDDGAQAPLMEFRYFRLDGTIIEAESQGTTIIYNGVPCIHVVIRDITERKRLENLLKENNSRLVLATQMAKMAWWEMDVLTGAISYDQRKVEMLGYTSGNFDHYKGFTDLIHPDDHEKTMNAMRGHLSGLFERYEVEYRIRTQSGEYLWFYDCGTAVKWDDKGKPLYISGYVLDISTQKRAEEELINSEARYSSMIANISDIIAIMDADGFKKYESPNLEKFFGWLPEDTADKSAFSFIHPDDKEYALKVFYSVLGENRSEKTLEFRYECKDGTYKPIELTISNLLSDPLINGLMVSFRDITERKLAEELLQKREVWYSAMISNISDVIGIMDANGLMTYKSSNIEKFFGWLPEERIGTSGFATIHPDDIPYAQNVFSSLLGEENSVKTLEFRYQCKDGTYKPIELTASNQLNNPAINGVLLNYHDISDRKAIEANLEEISEKYRGLSEASFESIFISEKGVCIEQNLTAELVFGYTTEEALTRYGTDWIVPEDREMVMNNMISGHQEPYEAMALRKDGSTFPCVLHGRMMQYKGKEVRVTSLSDISSLKKAEYALIIAKENAEVSEQKFVSIIQSQAEGIWFVNQNEVFEFANTASERIFETGKDELVGTCLYDFLQPGEREKVVHQTHNRVEGNANTYELKITTKKGNAKYIHITATPKLDGNKNYQGAYGVFRDITDRKKAEDQVQQVSTRLALATLAGGVGIWEYDIDNNTMLWDDQMYALYGIKAGDFGGVYETWRAGLHPDDAEKGDLDVQMAIRDEKDFDTEFRVIWPDQSVHSIKAIAIVKRDESGKALKMIGTNWDITEQKDAQEALSKARNEADAANRSKSVFLANMSHEIRTPLNAIIGFSQLLNREKLSDRQMDYSVSIHRSGEHLLKLLNDILELSKIEAGYGKLNPVNVDLHTLFADIRMLFSQQAQSKQLQLTFETADNLPQYILVDDNKLRQILINLIGNALKFTSKGRISVRATIEQSDDMRTILVIEVRDSGTGISEYEIGNLFRQFEQASEGIKQSNGTGLGLALSREQAILMGGNITVESKEGEGSVFTIRVEIKEGKRQAGEDLISKRVIGIDNTKDKYRVLVVDDKEENLRVVVDFLHWAGFETNEASGGEEAIAKFESWSPHLVLMDIRMPLMDGYEATKRIKATEKGKRTPFIALTASSFEVDWKNNAGFNFQGYIRKPFRESDLLGTIGNILGIKYIYGNETPFTREHHLNEDELAREISKLPNDLVLKMQNAVAAADLDLLINLIQNIASAHPGLSKYMMVLANDFDFNFLKKMLIKKEIR